MFLLSPEFVHKLCTQRSPDNRGHNCTKDEMGMQEKTLQKNSDYPSYATINCEYRRPRNYFR